jgi:hypothetical protein
MSDLNSILFVNEFAGSWCLLSSTVMTRQVVINLEPGYSLRVESMELGSVSLGIIERAKVQVNLVRPPVRFVAEWRAAALTELSSNAW